MTYAQAKESRNRIEAELKETSQILNSFPKLPNGLTPDHIKQTTEYQNAKAKSSALLAQLRIFNSAFIVLYKKEILEERRNRRP